jgi:uncharacterized repeat protein (TIGR03837 family)
MMRESPLTVDILCKVVDNFGDAGVVYRLARALSEADPSLRLRIIVDNLAAFHSLEPAVDPEAAFQEARGWFFVRWEAAADCFAREPPRLVLECFACGRPDWFEALLFDEKRTERRLIVDLEYLSAEAWVEDFHLLPSLTRSPAVAKLLFMPGFTAKTGGLILDRDFMEGRALFSSPSRQPERVRLLGDIAAKREASALRSPTAPAPSTPEGAEGRFWLSVFSYERDYARIVADLASYDRERPLLALVAAGKSAPCFFEAWENLGRPFPSLALPFLPQPLWDRVLLASDFAIVRGEDSLSRAALSGRPFLWQAYPQAEKQQLVKVKALLERLRPRFPPEGFTRLEALFTAFNDRLEDAADRRGAEELLPVLAAYDELLPGFGAFSREVVGNGNLALPLLTLLRDFV